MRASITRWLDCSALALASLLFAFSASAQTRNALRKAAGQTRPKDIDLRVLRAVEAGDETALRSLLQQHVNVNAAEADGATALSWPVYRDDVEAVNLLVAAGANVNVGNDYGAHPALACLR